MKKIFTSVIAALCLAAPVGNLSAQTSQQFTKSQEEAIKKELLPVVFEQIKEQAGIDILGWANPQLTNTFSSIPVLESSSLRAATANAINVKPDSLLLNLANISPDLAMFGNAKVTFSDYVTANLPVSIRSSLFEISMPKKIVISALDMEFASVDFTYDIQPTAFSVDVNMSIPLLQFMNKDLLACSVSLTDTNLNASVDIQDGLKTLLASWEPAAAALNVDYLVEVGISGLATGKIPASLYAVTNDAAAVKVPMGTAILTLNNNNTFPIEKIDVVSYTNGAPTDTTLFKLNMAKSNLTSTLYVDKYSVPNSAIDTTFLERTIIAMTDYTPTFPTTAEAAVQSVITRVVNELANEGKATWYELSIAKSKGEEEAEELVSIKVSPYISGTNAIADIDIVAGGSAYLVRATADLTGSQKIAVDVIQNETTYATAYFTSNILGAVTSNESVQVTDVKVIPMANAIRVLNADKASYQIYSISGAMMANGTIAGDAYISTANLAKGIYIVVVEANGVKQAVKFVR